VSGVLIPINRRYDLGYFLSEALFFLATIRFGCCNVCRWGCRAHIAGKVLTLECSEPGFLNVILCALLSKSAWDGVCVLNSVTLFVSAVVLQGFLRRVTYRWIGFFISMILTWYSIFLIPGGIARLIGHHFHRHRIVS